MSAWRREFIQRFPSLQRDAQAAVNASGLMHRPLFFTLKEALDQGDPETTRRVLTYVIWLDDQDSQNALAIQEDLLGPIVKSERLRTELFRQLAADEFQRIKGLCVESWRAAEERAQKLNCLEEQFQDIRR